MRTVERSGHTVTIVSVKLRKGRTYEVLAPRGTVWALSDGSHVLSVVASTEREALALGKALPFVTAATSTTPSPLLGRQ